MLVTYTVFSSGSYLPASEQPPTLDEGGNSSKPTCNPSAKGERPQVLPLPKVHADRVFTTFSTPLSLSARDTFAVGAFRSRNVEEESGCWLLSPQVEEPLFIADGVAARNGGSSSVP